MPLHNLTDYFNDRFQREHSSSFSPFIVEDDKVSGLFGPVRIDSTFVPLRKAFKPQEIVAHAAQLKVSTYEPKLVFANEIDSLIARLPVPAADFESIINFDRLCRTVHMLNYLPTAHEQGKLFLNVDPRHIVGVKQDHGAYFEEVIHQCGLATNQIVIVLTINSQYNRFYKQLINGLANYRQRGFEIAFKFDYLPNNNQAFDFIDELTPNYLVLSARQLEQVRESNLLNNLHRLKDRISAIGGISILHEIDDRRSAALARNIGFDWVEGAYFEQTPLREQAAAKAENYSKPLKTPEQPVEEGVLRH